MSRDMLEEMASLRLELKEFKDEVVHLRRDPPRDQVAKEVLQDMARLRDELSALKNEVKPLRNNTSFEELLKGVVGEMRMLRESMTVSLPPFFKANVTLWFARVEAVFALKEIDDEVTKYNLVVAQMDLDELHSCYNEWFSPVKTVINKPVSEDSYRELKAEIIAMRGLSLF